MKLRQWIKEWRTVIAILCIMFTLLLSGPFWFPFRFAHCEGTSMLPTFHNGAVVLVQIAWFNSAHIANGTVIVYKWNETFLICHRIIEVRLFCYICKGDNNLDIDPPVEPEQIYGICIAALW